MPDWSDALAARRAGNVPGFIGVNSPLGTAAPTPTADPSPLGNVLRLNSYQHKVAGLGSSSENWAPALAALWADALARKVAVIDMGQWWNQRAIRSKVVWDAGGAAGVPLEHLIIKGGGLAGSFLLAMTDLTVPAWTIANLDAVEIDLTLQGTPAVQTDAYRGLHFASCRTVTGLVQAFGVACRSANPVSGLGDSAVVSVDSCCVRLVIGARGCSVASPAGVTADCPGVVRLDNWITGSRIEWSQHTDFGVYDGGAGPVDNRKTGLFTGYSMLAVKNPLVSGTTGAAYDGGTIEVSDLRVDEGTSRSVLVLPDAGKRAAVVVIRRASVNSPSGGNGAGFNSFDLTRIGLLRMEDIRVGLGNGFSLVGVKLSDVTEAVLDNLVPLNAPSQAQISTDALCAKVTLLRSPLMDTSQLNAATVLVRRDTGHVAPDPVGFGTKAQRPVAPAVYDGMLYLDQTSAKLSIYVGGLWLDTTGAIIDAPAELREGDTLAGADGSAVAAWTDTSGNALPDLAQATGGNQPTVAAGANGIGGHKAVKFTGGTQWLQTVAYGAAVAQPHCVLLVYKFDNTSTAQQILTDGIVAATAADRFDSNGASKFYRLNSGSASTSATTFDGNAHVATIVWNGNQSVLRIDGVQVFAASPGANAPTGLTLGAKADGTAGYRGLIAVYTRRPGVLAATGLAAWERYYGAKYGIAVA